MAGVSGPRVVWDPTSAQPPVIRVGGVAEDPTWEVSLRLRNPTPGVMWVDLVPIGPALSAHPVHLGVPAGSEQTVRLTVTRAYLTRGSAADHGLQLSWNVIPPAGASP